MKIMCFLKVLESEGLDQYVDAKYLQRELEEATGMTEAELDSAAHELIRRASGSDLINNRDGGSRGRSLPDRHEAHRRSLYYEHLGGIYSNT